MPRHSDDQRALRDLGDCMTYFGGMKLIINGEHLDVTSVRTVADLLAARGLNPDRVVVELNMHIVGKDAYDSTVLGNDDRLELLAFVGGG